MIVVVIITHVDDSVTQMILSMWRLSKFSDLHSICSPEALLLLLLRGHSWTISVALFWGVTDVILNGGTSDGFVADNKTRKMNNVKWRGLNWILSENSYIFFSLIFVRNETMTVWKTSEVNGGLSFLSSFLGANPPLMLRWVSRNSVSAGCESVTQIEGKVWLSNGWYLFLFRLVFFWFDLLLTESDG